MHPWLVFSTAAAIAVAGNAQAQSTTVDTPKPVVKVVKDPNKMICRKLATTGSRLNAKNDCRTAQQWSDDQAIERASLDRTQANRYNGNSGQ